MTVMKTDVIKRYLEHSTHADLAAMYSHNMEVQITVQQKDGERVDGEYKGRKWMGYSNGQHTWKPFRIPWNAHAEATYEDSPLSWPFDEYVEAIGMTGWDWKAKRSRWVAFDFDSITGHSDTHTQKLTADELFEVRKAACSLPWVQVRKSTSGQGLHLYVFLEEVETNNHTEHSAVARAVLSRMSGLSGFDFNSRVDICGGNMWVFHQKMKGTEGLTLIKPYDTICIVPDNWRDHLDVIKGSRYNVNPRFNDNNVDTIFNATASQNTKVKLDNEHCGLIRHFDEKGYHYWWNFDHHMLVTHTHYLKQAHKDLNLRGFFETNSEGTNLNEQNCFMFPIRRGGWNVCRYSPGATEHSCWDQDGTNWTKCHYNVHADFGVACRAYGGLEDDKTGGFVFETTDSAQKAAMLLGADLKLTPADSARRIMLKRHKDKNRIVAELENRDGDSKERLTGWLQKGSKWTKIYNTVNQQNNQTLDYEQYEDIIRHLVDQNNENADWAVKIEEEWINEPVGNVQRVLSTYNLKTSEVSQIMGSLILKPWRLTTLPFQPEYPGDRMWNRNAPQLKVKPEIGDNLSYPTWDSIYNHVGQSLTPYVLEDDWCKYNQIKSGGEWLKLWLASLLQYPMEHLPYLFLYSTKQKTGKSMFHEAMDVLFTGTIRANVALKSQQGFNAELENIVFCSIEETNLRENKNAYDTIKEWVTGHKILIHRKMKTPYEIPNCTHWVQSANNIEYCPIFPGDTRIQMIHVPELPPNPIARTELLELLNKEAGNFLGYLLSIEIPPSGDRLRVPLVHTPDKQMSEDLNTSLADVYLNEKVFDAPGECITVAELFQEFYNSLSALERSDWTQNKFGRIVGRRLKRGRVGEKNTFHWINVSFKKPEKESKRLWVLHGDRASLKTT